MNHLDLANYVVGHLVHTDPPTPLTIEDARAALTNALTLLEDEQDGLVAVHSRDTGLAALLSPSYLSWEDDGQEAWWSTPVLRPSRLSITHNPAEETFDLEFALDEYRKFTSLEHAKRLAQETYA